jgi:hypothetical protein
MVLVFISCCVYLVSRSDANFRVIVRPNVSNDFESVFIGEILLRHRGQLHRVWIFVVARARFWTECL